MRLEVRKLDTLRLFSVLNPASEAGHLSIFHGRDEQLNAGNVNVSSLRYIWQLFYSFFFFPQDHLLVGRQQRICSAREGFSSSIGIKHKSLLVLHYIITISPRGSLSPPDNLHANECGAPRGELRFPAPLNLTRVIGASGQRMRKQSGNTPLRGWESDYKMSSAKIYLDLFILARRYAPGTVGA